ncbi:glycosyltransferase family 4 protein [Secundilactobacillus collinoides]|uniref:1,2-diacylglycerol 3-glucosyltransferase n=1 Tax=Secundilactobacillus collinoides TaxID=33960 RepID=A0A166H5A2_SECCO|nr:glycosyltransferase family 4 protein [Secundilactobacillus collinoides]KZL41472.1 1,2-diacylglycerol 3-glucosyltransferase [Secundilactobacillus collinoides]
MNIGLFTDTYFPQVSGVATSIKILKHELEKQGHRVYIFTTTDPHIERDVYERNIFRFPSVPFVSFTDRRIAFRGLFHAYQIAKELDLDIIHTQTEFSMGWIGKFVARNLKIPCLHTYHTMYEDYLHYVANGKILKPVHVKQMTLAFCAHLDGVVAPSDRVIDKLTGYGVKTPIRVIPTGIVLDQYSQPSDVDIRGQYGIDADAPLILSLSRLAYEKNIKEVIDGMPKVVAELPKAKLMIVGDGPARADLEKQAKALNLGDHVIFTGEINNDKVAAFYQTADLFASASDSESQGLTYIESLAAGTKIVVKHSPYTDELLSGETLGSTFSSFDEMVDDMVHFLKDPVITDQKTLKHTLHESSSDAFGEQVVAFYQDCQLAYEQVHEDSAGISN